MARAVSLSVFFFFSQLHAPREVRCGKAASWVQPGLASVLRTRPYRTGLSNQQHSFNNKVNMSIAGTTVHPQNHASADRGPPTSCTAGTTLSCTPRLLLRPTMPALPSTQQAHRGKYKTSPTSLSLHLSVSLSLSLPPSLSRHHCCTDGTLGNCTCRGA